MQHGRKTKNYSPGEGNDDDDDDDGDDDGSSSSSSSNEQLDWISADTA